MTQELAIWSSAELDLIKQQIAPGASDGELALFAQVCRQTGLESLHQANLCRQAVGQRETDRDDGLSGGHRRRSADRGTDGQVCGATRAVLVRPRCPVG